MNQPAGDERGSEYHGEDVTEMTDCDNIPVPRIKKPASERQVEFALGWENRASLEVELDPAAANQCGSTKIIGQLPIRVS